MSNYMHWKGSVVYSGILYVAATVAFTVLGQLIIKWQMNQVGPLPTGTVDKLYFLSLLLMRPWIVTGFVAAFLAAMAWMAAMTKFQLSQVYPFMSLAFVFVMIMSYFLFGEQITANKLIGTALVMVGLVVLAQ